MVLAKSRDDLLRYLIVYTRPHNNTYLTVQGLGLHNERLPASFHEQLNQSRPLSKENWPMKILKICQATTRES